MITPSVLGGLFPVSTTPVGCVTILGDDVTTPTSSFVGEEEVSVLSHIGPPESPTAGPDKYNWF